MAKVAAQEIGVVHSWRSGALSIYSEVATELVPKRTEEYDNGEIYSGRSEFLTCCTFILLSNDGWYYLVPKEICGMEPLLGHLQ